jgi:hypothetical protein
MTNEPPRHQQNVNAEETSNRPTCPCLVTGTADHITTVIPNKLTVVQLVMEFPTRRFITVFTTAHHIPKQTNPLHSLTLYLLRCILILSSHLLLDLPSVLFPSGFTAKCIYEFQMWPMRATRIATLTFHDLIALIMLVKNTDYECVYVCPSAAHTTLLTDIDRHVHHEQQRDADTPLTASPVTPVLLGSNVVPSTEVSNHVFSLM